MDERHHAIDAFLREVYGYWASGGLFAVASLAWGRVLMLLCVGLAPLTLASIDFNELATCRSRGACPSTADAYWRHPTATVPQVAALAFFVASTPIVLAFSWIAVSAVRRGLVLQSLVRDWAGVPDEELGLLGWDGVLRALGGAAARGRGRHALGQRGEMHGAGFQSNETERVEFQGASSAAASSASTIVARQDAALARLPADFKAVVDLLERSLPPPRPFSEQPSKLREARNAPELDQYLPKVQRPVDVRRPTQVSVASSSLASSAVQPMPAAASAARSSLLPPLPTQSTRLPFAALAAANPSVALPVPGRVSIEPHLVSSNDIAAASTRGVARLPGDNLDESTWLPLVPSPTQTVAGGPSDANAVHPLPLLLRPSVVAARILRLEGYLGALACSGALAFKLSVPVASPAPCVSCCGPWRPMRRFRRLCGRHAAFGTPAVEGESAGLVEERLPPPIAAAASSAPFQLTLPLPFTLSLQWALQALVLKPLISDRGTLQPQALSARGVKVIQTRCRWAGALGLAVVPVTLPLALLWVGLRQAEDALAARDYFGPRTWAPLATLLFAEYGELPHVVRRRLEAAREPAQRFIDAFPSPAASAVGRGVAFVAAALLALLAAVGATDEDALILVTLGGRSLWFYAALLGGLLAAARAVTQPATAALAGGSPGAAPLPAAGQSSAHAALCALAAALRFTPHAWGAGSPSWLLAARSEVSRLYLSRVFVMAAEAASALTTPLALLTVVPARVPAILVFVRENTVSLPGVGAVCAPPAPSVIAPSTPDSDFRAKAADADVPALPSFLRRGPPLPVGIDAVRPAERWQTVNEESRFSLKAEGQVLPRGSEWVDRLARSLASLAEEHPGEQIVDEHPWRLSSGGRHSFKVRPVTKREMAALGNGRSDGGAAVLSSVRALLSSIPLFEEGVNDCIDEKEGHDRPDSMPDSAPVALHDPSRSDDLEDLDAVGEAMQTALAHGLGEGSADRGSWAASSAYVPLADIPTHSVAVEHAACYDQGRLGWSAALPAANFVMST